MRTIVVAAAAAPVVTVEQAKDHLNVDHSDDDALIGAYLKAATATLDGPEGWLGRALGVQTLEARLDCFGVDPIVLRYPPIVEIVSIRYVNPNGVEQLLDPADYELLGQELDRAWGKSWPGVRAQREAVRIRYRAGYEGEVDPRIHAAILLMVGDLYANRETVVIGASANTIPMSTTVERLLSPLRIWR